MVLHWVAGITAARVVRILTSGTAVTINGMTVAMVLHAPDGTSSVLATPKITVLDDGSAPLRGQVQIKLASGDVVGGTKYFMRFRITDGSGLIDYWPDNAVPDLLDVGTA